MNINSLPAQVSVPNEITASKILNNIKLDGVLDEVFWEKAQRITNFTQREMHNGEPVSERTEVSIVYTSDAMYIGVWCYESDIKGIIAKNMKRDFEYWNDDNFEVIFDTYLDKKNGYVFVINPNGARSDVMTTDEGHGFNIDWNGVWDAAVVINEKGWFAEIEIPFSTLKFPDLKNQVWGVNFERNIRRKREQVFWQGWSRDYDFELVSHAGILKGLEDIKGKESIEIKPYTTAGFEKIDTNNKTVAKIGGDVNYLITPTMKLNLTLNTDFAQIEDDRSQVNLTRFSLYFPEKREFFLEGYDNFKMDFGESIKLFHTRTIGIHNGEEVPIIGGARLMGKLDKTNIGFLTMQTQAKDNIPSTNYTVLRMKQDIFEKSYVGMILTAKNDSKHFNYVYGADFAYNTSSLFGDRNFHFYGGIAQSLTKGIDSKNNLSVELYTELPSDEFFVNMEYKNLQENFNPEMGFLKRGNYKYKLLNTQMLYRPRTDFLSLLRQFDFKPYEITCYWTEETNELETAYFEFRPVGFVTKSAEYFTFNIVRVFERLDNPFTIFENIQIPAGKYWFTVYELALQTYQGRNMSMLNQVSWGSRWTGTSFSYYGQLLFNLNKHINLSADYEYNNFDLQQGKFVTNNVGGRIDFAFNPKMNTSLFGQWNNEVDEIILNFRFSWIPVIGSDVYFVINQRYSTVNDKIIPTTTTILAKVIWRFSL
ncbi:MAG: carbohydrate binding family 9 domain-containing protein [Ignavibacteriae bacterium]|nr:carbohydrate binding family 9 domain-containing protein [Ignavibacteriota bacterium]